MTKKNQVSLTLVAEGKAVGMTVKELIAGLQTLPLLQQVYVFNEGQLLRLDCLASSDDPWKQAVIIPSSLQG